MRQVLHIFFKDVRRLGIEISVSIVALVLVTWSEWWLCSPARNPRWYNELIPVLVLFFSWWFMIARLIQDEALVGDRQFWLTRPYVWYKLLAAKVLFVFVCVGAPLAISQVVLLVMDRAVLAPYLGKIALDTGGTMLIGILPVAALASITRNLSHWMMGVVLVALIAVGIASLDSYVPNSHVSTGTDISEMLQAVAFTGITVLGIIIQYARRNRLWASLAVAAAVVAVPIIMVVTPYRSIIASTFPVVSPELSPFQVAIVPKEETETGTSDTSKERRVKLAIPVEISGVPEDTLLRLDGVMLSIDLPDGRRWDSEWQPGYQDVLEPMKRLSLDVQVDRNVYERVKTTPTPVRLSIAFTQLHDRHRQHVVVDQSFELPGVGHCWLDRDGYSFECRSTENGPPLLMVVVSEDESTCPMPESVKSAEKGGVTRTLDSNSASGPLSPLTLRTFYLRQWSQSSANWVEVCSGTPLTLSAPEVVRRFRLELRIEQLRLGKYAAGQLVFN